MKDNKVHLNSWPYSGGFPEDILMSKREARDMKRYILDQNPSCVGPSNRDWGPFSGMRRKMRTYEVDEIINKKAIEAVRSKSQNQIQLKFNF